MDRAMTAPELKAHELAALNRAFNDRFMSLARYALDAQPYVPEKMEWALEDLRRIAEADRRAADRLAKWIAEHGGIAQTQPIPPRIAEWNYLALDFILNSLIDELTAQRERYRRELADIQTPAVRDMLGWLIRQLDDDIIRLRSHSGEPAAARGDKAQAPGDEARAEN